MAVFQYTLFKYFKSPSTWIILILSMFISGFLGGWLPFHVVAATNKESVKVYSMTVVGIVGAGASFLAIFISVFAGFKVASMYKDEVEDGTFLIMLSKPKTRGRIIFEKWLALQATMIIYSVLTIIAFMIAIKVNDPGPSIVPAGSVVSTLTSRLWIVSLTMLGVLVVIGFIFTSLALLLSTVVSAGSTIGITIALGVVIPITSMVSTFTTTPAYASLKASKLDMTNTIFNSGIDTLEKNLGNIYNSVPATLKVGDYKQNTQSFIDSMRDFSEHDLLTDIKKITEGKDGLANLGLTTGKSDDFKKAYFFDLSYQVHSLGSLASDLVVPKEFAALTSDSKWGKITGIPMTTKVTDSKPFTQGQEYNQMLDLIIKNMEPVIQAGKKGQELLAKSGLFDYNDDYPWNEPILKPEAEGYIKAAGESDSLKQIINTFHDLIVSPLYFVINPDAIDSNFDPNKYTYSTVDSTSPNRVISDKLDDYFNEGLETYSYEGVEYTRTRIIFSSAEKRLENKLLVIARHDDEYGTNSFARVERVPYANKHIILYIYLAIAILLTPLSFLVVRRQDFK